MMAALLGLELLPGFERIVHNLTRIFHVGFLLSAGELYLYIRVDISKDINSK